MFHDSTCQIDVQLSVSGKVEKASAIHSLEQCGTQRARTLPKAYIKHNCKRYVDKFENSESHVHYKTLHALNQ